jgi:hypothetical protein
MPENQNPDLSWQPGHRESLWSAARLQAESLTWVVWSVQVYPACL